MVQLPFRDREEAGQLLAEALAAEVGLDHPLVLALPRGGVPVAFAIARRLGAPLDVFVVRKLGVPGHEELAMGAIASGGVRVLNEDVIEGLGIRAEVIERVAVRETRELERREALYRDGRDAVPIRGRSVLLVDDGLATGASMRVAVAAVRQDMPRMVVVAVPVSASETFAVVREEADRCVCLATPEPFDGVGLWYRDFAPTTDGEVRALLAAARNRVQAST
ncbi:MAG: phosphoribosyltransferase [Dehalococcoidia bacterium]|nr:phosphoribosyltransferase [Dehalococcoidia bacterium]